MQVGQRKLGEKEKTRYRFPNEFANRSLARIGIVVGAIVPRRKEKRNGLSLESRDPSENKYVNVDCREIVYEWRGEQMRRLNPSAPPHMNGGIRSGPAALRYYFFFPCFIIIVGFWQWYSIVVTEEKAPKRSATTLGCVGGNDKCHFCEKRILLEKLIFVQRNKSQKRTI